jgi:hypothetical protein
MYGDVSQSPGAERAFRRRRMLVSAIVWAVGLTTGLAFFIGLMGGRLRPFVAAGSSSRLLHRAVKSCELGTRAKVIAETRGDVDGVTLAYRIVGPRGKQAGEGSLPLELCPAAELWAVSLPPLERGWSYRYVVCSSGPEQLRIPPSGELRARFEGDVPGVLIGLHVVPTLLAALLLLGAFHSSLGELVGVRLPGSHRAWVWLAVLLFTVGAIVVGAVVAGIALGAPWGGWPFGSDVTDTKSELIALYWAALLVATVRKPRASAIGTALGVIGTLVLYLLPHGGVS